MSLVLLLIVSNQTSIEDLLYGPVPPPPPQAVIQNPFSNGGSPVAENIGGETRFAYFPAATVSDGTATAVSVQAAADPTISQAGGEYGGGGVTGHRRHRRDLNVDVFFFSRSVLRDDDSSRGAADGVASHHCTTHTHLHDVSTDSPPLPPLPDSSFYWLLRKGLLSKERPGQTKVYEY